MRWRKLGRIYQPHSSHHKLKSHASNPLAVLLDGDVYRIFFCGRDDENRSSIGFVDIDIETRRVVYEPAQPVFDHGPPNSFCSHGVSLGSCYEVSGTRYILFMGWQRPRNAHWHGVIGRLVLQPDYSLQLDGLQPFMDLNDLDRLSLSYPWALCDPQGTYRMWYGSTVTWDAGNGEMLHVINQATSDDGHNWNREGVAIPFQFGVAQAFSRPSVICDPGGISHMWFSYRGNAAEKYRIGYATQNAGERWTLRLQDAGIDVSSDGWDSEMIEYPFVFDHNKTRFLVYNGNGFGKTGFGLAQLE